MKEKLETNRKIAVIVGVLFIIGTVAGILSYVVTGPVLSNPVTGPVLGNPDFLAQIATDPNPIAIGALLVLVMGFTLAMVPVVIFPVLKKHNEILALGYVVFRGALEPITYIGIAFCWLLLIPLSRESLTLGASAGLNYLALGNLMVDAAKISSTLCAIIFPLGAIMFYIVLYQSKLIPRWISVWGLVAVILNLLSTGLADMFSLMNSMSNIQTILSFPIFLQEMVMAVWLIVKGFNENTIVSPAIEKATTKA